jgi:hypothetical protein
MKTFSRIASLVTVTFAGLTCAAATCYLTFSWAIKNGYEGNNEAGLVCLILGGAVGFIGFVFTFVAVDCITESEEV